MSRYVNRFIQITVLFIFLIPATLQVVQQHYTAMGAISGSAKLIQFESDNITLKLTSGGIVGGWKIIPLTSPVVRKFIVVNQHLS